LSSAGFLGLAGAAPIKNRRLNLHERYRGSP
jgi:hypothetical protein